MSSDQDNDIVNTCIRLFSEEVLKFIMGLIIAFVVGIFVVVPGIEFFGIKIPIPCVRSMINESSDKKTVEQVKTSTSGDEEKVYRDTKLNISKADSYFKKGGVDNMIEAFKIYKSLADTSPDKFKNINDFKYVCRQVAKCYKNGWGTERDEPKAVNYERKARIAQ